jgi:hypothetical protein
MQISEMNRWQISLSFGDESYGVPLAQFVPAFFALDP